MVQYKKSWSPEGSRKNTFPGLGVDPSRLAALLVRGVCAVLAPCQTGVSAPKPGKVFLREPLVVIRHFCIVPGALRVRHEITGTIGRPRFVIGARRDERA